MRIAVLRCTNATNDPVIVQGLQRIHAYGQEVANHGDNVVVNSLATLTVQQLQNISKVAKMDNTPTTIAAFTKAAFALDFNALNAKKMELKYLEDAQVAVAEYALNAQYYNGTKLDIPKFKDDVETAIKNVATGQGRQEGYAAGHAAGLAAAAKAKAAA